MITPAFLTTNDLVAIVAPGGKVQQGELDRALEILASWGLQPRLGKNVYSHDHSYLAGNDGQRLADLQDALDDEDVKAVFCARGGYGTSRILDQVNFTAFMKRPKWIAGFSDITALHLALSAMNVESIHSTMPLLFAKAGAGLSIRSLQKLLFGNTMILHGKENAGNRTGTATGQLTGGNLSLLIDSLGTRYELNTAGKVLLIEEVEEYNYKVDRMLTQLKRSGKFEALAGMVIGYTTGIYNGKVPFNESIEEIVLDKVSGYDFPVAFGFSFGHEEPNMAIRLGQQVKLTVTKEGSSIEPV